MLYAGERAFLAWVQRKETVLRATLALVSIQITTAGARGERCDGLLTGGTFPRPGMGLAVEREAATCKRVSHGTCLVSAGLAGVGAVGGDTILALFFYNYLLFIFYLFLILPLFSPNLLVN